MVDDEPPTVVPLKEVPLLLERPVELPLEGCSTPSRKARSASRTAAVMAERERRGPPTPATH